MSTKSKRNTFKVILLGDGSVGKTSLRHMFLGDGFREKYSMTIGADFAVKRFKDVTIQIWDLAGQARFKTVREVYYQGAVGAIVVFDVTRPDTFKSVPDWLKELLKNNKNQIIPTVLVGNKVDLRELKGVTTEDGEKYAQALSKWSGTDVHYIETSAKMDINVKETFEKLLQEMTKNN